MNLFKFFGPLILGLIILFIFFKEISFFKTINHFCKELIGFCKTNLKLKKITKYSIILFTITKLAISLYVISLIFTPKPIYAFILMIFLLGFSSLVLYKIWTFPKSKQKTILFISGTIVFGFISLFIFSMIFNIGLYFLIKIKTLDFLNLSKEFFSNIRFNLFVSITSLIVFNIALKFILKSLEKIKIQNEKTFNLLIGFINFFSSFPKILYGISCFFLNQTFNQSQNFLILSFICSLHLVLFSLFKKIKTTYCFDSIPQNSNCKTIYKNKIYEILLNFWNFLNEITIISPVFLISKNIQFNEFYSNILKKLFKIFENHQINQSELLNFEINFILLSGIIFLIINFIFIFFKRKNLIIKIK